MELWSYGVMELWSYGVMELWSYGVISKDKLVNWSQAEMTDACLTAEAGETRDKSINVKIHLNY